MEPENKPNLFDDDDEEEYKPQEQVTPVEEVPVVEVQPPAAEEQTSGQATEETTADGGDNKIEIESDVIPSVEKEKKPAEEAAAPTDAELKHNEEAERARNELLAQITEFKPEEDAIDAASDAFEQDDYNPREAAFSVTEPVKVNSIVKYTVKGVDDDGDFTCQRRFKEFFALSVQLRTRWPGCFIPAIPEKKYFGGNDSEYVEERRELLEKFLKDCARFDYIIFSKEFKLFSRGQGEIDKALN